MHKYTKILIVGAAILAGSESAARTNAAWLQIDASNSFIDKSGQDRTWSRSGGLQGTRSGLVPANTG